MKKFITMISFAAFLILSAGCGSNDSATDNAKNSAETVVENKVEEVKQDAALKVQDVANEVSQKAGEIAESGNNSTSMQEIALGGISPGMTFDEVKNILGEPSSTHDHDEFTFANGLIVEFDDHKNVVEEIKVRQAGISASGGIEVGMAEQKLLEVYGQPARKEIDDGATEYKYFSSDRTKKIVFKVYNSKISEIKCELDN